MTAVKVLSPTPTTVRLPVVVTISFCPGTTVPLSTLYPSAVSGVPSYIFSSLADSTVSGRGVTVSVPKV